MQWSSEEVIPNGVEVAPGGISRLDKTELPLECKEEPP